MTPLEDILNTFEQIAAIPRCSGNERGIRDWLLGWARQRSFDSQVDAAGNLILRVPGIAGGEGKPPVILQAHMDMVCEKNPGVEHDFSRDPIRPVREGEWLKAQGTTLGADNGIGIALALSIAQAEDLPHPSLELLFTVEEETSLAGAVRLDANLLRGRTLLNLDSEEEGILIVGCAGGAGTQIRMDGKLSPLPEDWQVFDLKISGLQGGHSGVDIHKGRGNALVLLARALDLICQTTNLRLLSIQGGTASNAIPRQAEAQVALPKAAVPTVQLAMDSFAQGLRSEFAHTDPNLSIQFQSAHDGPRQAWEENDSQKTIWLLAGLPHGVAVTSQAMPGFVETSNNLARVSLEGKTLQITTSQRSSVMSQMEALTRRIEAVAHLAGAQINSSVGYPAWQPDLSSSLLQISQQVYQQTFGKPAQVKAIHAGLECGVIGSHVQGMDMVSLGPTLQNPHSPSERLNLPSVERIWQFLTAMMRQLAEA